MIEDRSLKRLRKKARRCVRGWPVGTIALYWPNLNQTTPVAVGIGAIRERRGRRDARLGRGSS